MARPSLQDDLLCLFCRRPLPRSHGTSVRCGACGQVNLRVDHGTYWTRTPGAVATERLLKIGGTAAMAAATWMLMGTETGPMETGFKIFVAMGMLIPTVLWWDLSSLRTRRVSRSRFELFVPATFLAASVFPIAWALFQALRGDVPDVWAAFKDSLGLFAAAQPFAFASWWLVRSMRWLRRSEMEAARSQGAAAPRPRGESDPLFTPAPAPSSRAIRTLRTARGLVNARPSTAHGGAVRSKKSTSCLHCFAVLPPMEGASQTCPACSRTTRKVDQAIFWTRHEALIRKERRVKALIGALTAVAINVIYINVGRLSEQGMWGAPTAIAMSVAVAALAWDLAGLITRHRSMLRLEWLLPVAIGSFGIGAVIFGRIAMTGKPSFDRGAVRDALYIPWSFAIPFLFAGLITHLLLRWFLDWREETRARLALGL